MKELRSLVPTDDATAAAIDRARQRLGRQSGQRWIKPQRIFWSAITAVTAAAILLALFRPFQTVVPGSPPPHSLSPIGMLQQAITRSNQYQGTVGVDISYVEFTKTGQPQVGSSHEVVNPSSGVAMELPANMQGSRTGLVQFSAANDRLEAEMRNELMKKLLAATRPTGGTMLIPLTWTGARNEPIPLQWNVRAMLISSDANVTVASNGNIDTYTIIQKSPGNQSSGSGAELARGQIWVDRDAGLVQKVQINLQGDVQRQQTMQYSYTRSTSRPAAIRSGGR